MAAADGLGRLAWPIGRAGRAAMVVITSRNGFGVGAGTWIPGQRPRMCQLAPGTWQQALADVLAVSPARPDDGPGHPVDIAIYPDVIWLATHSLRSQRDRGARR